MAQPAAPEPIGADDSEPFFADGGHIVQPDTAKDGTAWQLPEVADPPREKFVDFGNDKFSIAAKPNLLLRFKPEATQSRSTQPAAPQPAAKPSTHHQVPVAPVSARVEPAVVRPSPPSTLTAPHDLAGSLVLD